MSLDDVTIPLLGELVRDAIVVHEGRPHAHARWRSHALSALETDGPWYRRMRDAFLAHRVRRVQASTEADLQEQFATRKLVERAKSLLITRMGLTEPEAFRWIQKTSMDRRLSMREVAEAIINQVS